MQKEVWGVNVIGNQGVNAVNDFSIRPSDDGTDVIVSVNGAELSGEEFAELKEIAETGGGGTPDPGDATNGDFLGVKVTPAVKRFVPAIKVGDHLNDIYGYVHAAIDFDALTYDDSIEGQMPASLLLDINVHMFNDGAEEVGHGKLLAFKMAYDTQTITGISFLPDGSHFGKNFMYLAGIQEMGFEGWNPDGTTGDFCSFRDIFAPDFDECYIEVLGLGATSQDIWGQFIGGSKTMEDISPETKEVIWEKPYPAIKKAGQALVTVGEEYNLYPGLKVADNGQFYFNIEDEDSVKQTLHLFANSFNNGFTIQILKSDKESVALAIGFVRMPSQTTGLDHDTEVIAVMNVSEQLYDIVYAIEEFDWTDPFTQQQKHVVEGWNEAVNNCTWEDGYKVKIIAGSNVVTPEQAKKQYVPYYGVVLTVQDGLFYGDIRNSSAQWQDINALVKPDDYETTNMSDTSYLMVEDNNGKMKRLNYNDTKPTSGTLTLYSGSWTASGDEFRCDISIDGMTDSDTLVASPSTKSDAIAAQDANIYYADSNGSEVEFYCTTQPSNNIQFKYTLIKG